MIICCVECWKPIDDYEADELQLCDDCRELYDFTLILADGFQSPALLDRFNTSENTRRAYKKGQHYE